MTDPQFVPSLTEELQKAQLSSLPLTAWPTSTAPFAYRRRGNKGRREAAERIIFDGSGPSAGLQLKGCDVVVTGVPGYVSDEQMARYLNSKKLVSMRRDGELDCTVLTISSYVLHLLRMLGELV